jgi:hypothetical protein
VAKTLQVEIRAPAVVDPAEIERQLRAEAPATMRVQSVQSERDAGPRDGEILFTVLLTAAVEGAHETYEKEIRAAVRAVGLKAGVVLRATLAPFKREKPAARPKGNAPKSAKGSGKGKRLRDK